MRKLGTPTTLGELRKMTEQFPDETLLQFRNEPRHELFFDNEQGLVCQHEDWQPFESPTLPKNKTPCFFKDLEGIIYFGFIEYYEHGDSVLFLQKRIKNRTCLFHQHRIYQNCVTEHDGFTLSTWKYADIY